MKNSILILLILLSQNLLAQISFDSDLESGNLKSVTEITPTTFSITTQEDLGPDGGSTRWFYFRMNGVLNKTVNLTFANTDVTKAMYSYDNKNFMRFSDEEVPVFGSFQKTFTNDTVYVSYYTPYNFSYLQERIKKWENNNFVSLDTLGFTPQGLPIQEIIITDFTVPSNDKKSIWIHARTHTSETPSSWHFDGIVQELLSGKEVVDYYLTQFEFHLIPFTNPDGVFYGRSRVNFEGINLETNWDKSENLTSEEVKILRARMQELNDEKPFSIFLNLHSQVSSYCTFWIHSSGSTSNLFYTKENQFANLNISDNPYFLLDDLSFSNLKPIYPEGWLWNNYGDQVMALTYETPYNNYFSIGGEPNIEVSNENLFEIGKRTVYAIAEYLQISHPKHYIMDNSDAIAVGDYFINSSTLEFYGEDFTILNINAADTYITFESEKLPSGSYDVAAWWPTSSGNSFETVYEITAGSNYYEATKTQKINGGQWNYLTNVELNEEGSISIKLTSNSTGLVVADAFRLIYNGPITDVHITKLPADFKLYQNYPNPFNPVTNIRYSIPNIASELSAGQESFTLSQNIFLIVFDVLGREIITLVNEEQLPGEYEVSFNGSGLSSGTYFYRLQYGNFVETKKMILVK